MPCLSFVAWSIISATPCRSESLSSYCQSKTCASLSWISWDISSPRSLNLNTNLLRYPISEIPETWVKVLSQQNTIHHYLSSDIRSSFWTHRTNMTAKTSKGKGHTPSQAASVTSTKGRDWRLYGLDTDFPLSSELSAIRCPFTIEPWTKDTIPIGYQGDAWHYINRQIFEGTTTPVHNAHVNLLIICQQMKCCGMLPIMQTGCQKNLQSQEQRHQIKGKPIWSISIPHWMELWCQNHALLLTCRALYWPGTF